MTVRDRILLGQIVALQSVAALQQGVRSRARRVLRDQRGQTPTEYLMIVGLMAAIIVLVFVTFFWGQIRGAASTWVGKVRDSILGTSITP